MMVTTRRTLVRNAAATTIQRAWRKSLSDEPNLISLSRFPRVFAYKKGPQTYDARQLQKLLNTSRNTPRWPHSRQPITAQERSEITRIASKYQRRPTRRSSSTNYYADLGYVPTSPLYVPQE